MGVPFLEQLQMYAARMKQYITRPMMDILGANHVITLLFHCYVADIMSVLANCCRSINVSVTAENENGLISKSFSKANKKSSRELPLQKKFNAFWTEAGFHYSYALQRSLSVNKSIYNSNTHGICSVLARTLREMNSPSLAVNLLSTMSSSIS